jgi:hypothetical protein
LGSWTDTTQRNKMDRRFIYSDLGEFGFNQLHIWKDDKWTWLDLEVDCDAMTIRNFSENNDLIFQFWVHEDKTKFCLASNFMGHKRQADIPLAMLEKLKVTFTEPAKGGGEFDLSIDSEKYRGEIISGKIKVARNKNDWDTQDYRVKRKNLEKIIETVQQLTGGVVTGTTDYINA